MDHTKAKDELKRLLIQSVSYRIQSDVPVGLYYSGGVDSTAIGIAIKEILPEMKMTSYTAVSENVPKDQKEVIMRMSDTLRLDNRMVESDLKPSSSLLLKSMWHMETPFSPSIVLDHVLNKQAKKDNITVVIEGQGADESQTGYLHYFFPYLVDCIKSRKFRNAYELFKNRPRKFRKNYTKELLREAFRYTKLYSLLRKRSNPLVHSLVSPKLQEIYYKKNKSQPIKKSTNSHLVNSQFYDYSSKLLRVLRAKDRISIEVDPKSRTVFLMS
jgi:asparagine synthetase B (glutamine-hydrolysing)